jgi:hypothetical protein
MRSSSQSARLQLSGRVTVTVVVRSCPWLTVPCGTWVARPAKTTMLPPGGDGSQLGQRMRPVLGDHRLVGKSREGSRQPGVEG